MKRIKTNLKNLVEVPEEVLRETVKYIPEEEDSGIRDVLLAADEYRAANLTPVFILDHYNMDILVVCKETFGKRLH
jgi:hypothetical protein